MFLCDFGLVIFCLLNCKTFHICLSFIITLFTFAFKLYKINHFNFILYIAIHILPI